MRLPPLPTRNRTRLVYKDLAGKRRQVDGALCEGYSSHLLFDSRELGRVAINVRSQQVERVGYTGRKPVGRFVSLEVDCEAAA